MVSSYPSFQWSAPEIPPVDLELNVTPNDFERYVVEAAEFAEANDPYCTEGFAAYMRLHLINAMRDAGVFVARFDTENGTGVIYREYLPRIVAFVFDILVRNWGVHPRVVCGMCDSISDRCGVRPVNSAYSFQGDATMRFDELRNALSELDKGLVDNALVGNLSTSHTSNEDCFRMAELGFLIRGLPPKYGELVLDALKSEHLVPNFVLNRKVFLEGVTAVVEAQGYVSGNDYLGWLRLNLGDEFFDRSALSFETFVSYTDKLAATLPQEQRGNFRKQVFDYFRSKIPCHIVI